MPGMNGICACAWSVESAIVPDISAVAAADLNKVLANLFMDIPLPNPVAPTC